MSRTLGKIDAWESICRKVSLDPRAMPFVSQPIDQDVISEFGEPRLLIPIYSQTSMMRYPFLAKHGIMPVRVGIGKAVLTRAKLFIDIPEPSTRSILKLTCSKQNVPISLNLGIETEAKHLCLAFETGVLRKGLGVEQNSEISLGLFGKMNLPSAEIVLLDEDGKEYLLDLRNVQFDLDFSIETVSDVYLIEAKMGSPKTFSALQLFYPLTLIANADTNLRKRIQTILITIRKTSESTIRYSFFRYKFRFPRVANSLEFSNSRIVDLQIV